MAEGRRQANHSDLIVIGAGAAGLMCAGTAAKRGCSVRILDHADKAGKKILISGGGRCNFTNRYASAAHYISRNPHFCKSALARFSAADFIDWVERSGIAYHERKHGQLFCDNSARDILEMLLQPCREAGVEMLLNCSVTSIALQADVFHIATDRGDYTASALVIATGGLSIPKMGATPFGLQIAEQFGHRIVPPVAGLVPFTFSGREKAALQRLAGISLDVRVSCGRQQFEEAMLFTHRGLSGPAILQISSYWQPGEVMTIDLLPGVDVMAWLRQKRAQQPRIQLLTALSERLPKRLAKLLLQARFDAEQRLNQLTPTQIQQLDDDLHHWQLKPSGTEGYRTAEVTCGGVDTRDLSSKTMMSRHVPNLYFIGEVVDVTGHLGGFNFQWAWSSGYAAGVDVSKG